MVVAAASQVPASNSNSRIKFKNSLEKIIIYKENFIYFLFVLFVTLFFVHTTTTTTITAITAFGSFYFTFSKIRKLQIARSHTIFRLNVWPKHTHTHTLNK